MYSKTVKMCSVESSRTPELDLVLVGGGLQNALIALATLSRRPDAALTVVEAAKVTLGNHTWCVHAGDVPPAGAELVSALVDARWPGYEVRFPGFSRILNAPYAAISSQRLREVLDQRLSASPRAKLLLNSRVAVTSATHVELDDGRVLEGRVVVDARGPGSDRVAARAYQKFVGLELELEQPSSLTLPILMDATVPQTDGFRFFYVLPFEPRRVLVEDTYFSDSPNLDHAAIEDGILRYARGLGLRVGRVLRQEFGVLPLPVRARQFHTSGPLIAGYAGGFFHPATGYSFPAALRLALHIAEHLDDPFADAFQRLLASHRTQFRFGAFLNRLLFSTFRPEDRWHALARFYRFPEGVIRRFYAQDSTVFDRARVLCGRPPAGLSLSTLIARGALA